VDLAGDDPSLPSPAEEELPMRANPNDAAVSGKRWTLLATVLVVAVASCAGPACAGSQDSGRTGRRSPLDFPVPWQRYGTLYVGGSAGMGAYQKHVDANDDGSLTNIHSDDSGMNWNLRLGFQFRYGGLETGYMDLGKADMKARSSGGTSWSAGDVTAGVKSHGWLWTAFARYPITERWAALLRLGGFTWQSREDFTETFGPSSQTDNGTSATLGFGLEFDPGKLQHIVLRTEYDHFVVDADDLPVNSFTFGIDREW
jgi:hypothetical protein